MSGLIPRATELAHLLLALAAGPGCTVIDATAGQGRDTCFLAALVGETGRVWAFDIQEQACLATEAALEQQGLAPQAWVIHDDHANIGAYDIKDASAAVFNLGWLPGGDHSVVSRAGSVLQAMRAIFDKLLPGGVIVVVAYPGHESGAQEMEAIQVWLSALPPEQAQAMQITYPDKKQAPAVFLIEKAGRNR